MKSITFKLTPTELFLNDEITIMVSEEAYTLFIQLCFLDEDPESICEYLDEDEIEPFYSLDERIGELLLDKDNKGGWKLEYSESFLKDADKELYEYSKYDLPCYELYRCTECGLFDITYILGEDTFVCKDCLGNDYVACAECGELWNDSSASLHKIDGKYLCDDCYQEHINTK